MVEQSQDPAQGQADWVTVGRIKTVYGVRGWLKVESFTEPANNLLSYISAADTNEANSWRLLPEAGAIAAEAGVTVDRRQQAGAVQVDEAKLRNNDILIHLVGVDDREAAQRFSRHFIQVAKTALPAASDGDYYWHQLEGLRVYQVATNGHEEFLLGQVDYLLATGANDVLVISRENGSGEVLIPYRPGAVVKAVDLDEGRMLVDWYYD